MSLPDLTGNSSAYINISSASKWDPAIRRFCLECSLDGILHLHIKGTVFSISHSTIDLFRLFMLQQIVWHKTLFSDSFISERNLNET